MSNFQQIRQIADRAGMQEAITSPSISNLPPELLSLLVEWACRLDSASLWRVTLCLVSRAWHDAVVSTPAIWTTIKVGAYTSERQIQLALGLSGSVGLHITLETERHDTANQSPSSVIQSLERIAAHSSRWASFSASTMYSGPSPVHLPPTLPALRHLSLQESKAAPGQQLVLPSTPSLQTLSIGGFQVEWAQLAFPELQKLEITQCEQQGQGMWQFLRSEGGCPSLRKLVLKQVGEGSTGPSRPVYLRRLEELCLVDIVSSGALGSFELPALRKISVGKSPTLRRWRWQPVDIHFPCVQEVTLIELSTSLAALRNVLHATPNASIVRILQMDLTDPLSHSAEFALQERTWSSLRELIIHGTFSLEQLKKVVVHHRETLERVRVHCLDLGLTDESVRGEWEEHEAALAWLQAEVMDFGVDHLEGVQGNAYKTQLDARAHRQMSCSGKGCALSS